MSGECHCGEVPIVRPSTKLKVSLILCASMWYDSDLLALKVWFTS